MRIVQLLIPVALLGLAVPSFAANPAEKRGFLFPPFKKREAPAQPAPAPAPAPDPTTTVTGVTQPQVVKTTAVVGPDGVWQWVDRMQGEVPTQAQVQGVEEKTEEQIAERGLVDDLSGSPAPLQLYRDPLQALAVDPLFLDEVDPKEFDIPVEVNDMVAKWVRWFTGDGRQYYERWLARSTRYQPMMREKLKAAGLPQDLVFLSMIESGYNPHAYSHSDAAGLWQFIPSTGRLYDLRIDWWVDERRDPETSVDAAIVFLGELYKMFGDWRLAWASYNGGPGRVKRATDRAGTSDFWTLVDADYLMPETENYVPKIMAAAIIGKHPDRYGFNDISYESPLKYDVAHVSGSVELNVLAKCAGISLDSLQELNPALRRFATPPEGYDLRIPAGGKTAFVAALDKVPASERLTVVKHTVKRGETLSIIAKKYHSTVDALVAANDLRNIDRIEVGTTLIVPRGDGEAVAVAATKAASLDKEPAQTGSASAKTDGVVLAAVAPVRSTEEARTAPKTAPTASHAAAPAPKELVHTVVKGESLSGIATKYGTTVAALKTANGLSSTTIEVGQKIKLPAGSVPAAPPAPTWHTVAKGETLMMISRKYDVDPEKIQAWNDVDDPSHIEVGQKLCVSGPSPDLSAWTTYTVRNGDSLSKIATKNGCTVDDIKAWNKLGKSEVIQPGQKLRIQRSSS